MTEQQVQWAAQHDWYIARGINSDNIVFVRVAWVDRYYDFTDFKELRAWAGY